jgi:hypothetical protein
VPSDEGVQLGYVPWPSVISTAQQTGVAPLQSFGPSHEIAFWVGHAPAAVHSNMVVAPGMAQHSIVLAQGIALPHGKSSTSDGPVSAPLSAVPVSGGGAAESRVVAPPASGFVAPVSGVGPVVIPASVGRVGLETVLLLHADDAMATSTAAPNVQVLPNIAISAPVPRSTIRSVRANTVRVLRRR